MCATWFGRGKKECFSLLYSLFTNRWVLLKFILPKNYLGIKEYIFTGASNEAREVPTLWYFPAVFLWVLIEGSITALYVFLFYCISIEQNIKV